MKIPFPAKFSLFTPDIFVKFYVFPLQTFFFYCIIYCEGLLP